MELNLNSQLDPTFFNMVCLDLLQFIKNIPLSVSPNSRKKSVMFETRALAINEFAIRNTLSKLGPGWAHRIYCSKENYQQIKTICDAISPDIEIELTESIDRNKYNAFLLSKEFWLSLDCDQVFIYQTDTLLFKPVDDRFLKYDYLGARWSDSHANLIHSKTGKKPFFGNGGLSIRSVDLMLRILEGERIDEFKDFLTQMDHLPEDMFFSIHLEKYSTNLPSIDDCNAFSFETNFTKGVVGCHQPWHSKITKSTFLEEVATGFRLDDNPNRLLTVNHEEGRTGAPKILKDIISSQAFVDRFENWNYSIKIGDDPWKLDQNIRLSSSQTDYVFTFIEKILNPHTVLANTIVSLTFVHNFRIKKMIWLHEYKSILPMIHSNGIQKIKDFSKVWVACKKTKDLLEKEGISSEVLCYYFKHEIEETKKENLFFLSAGWVQQRKGIKRFLELASSLPRISFYWVGSYSGVTIKHGKIQVPCYSHHDAGYNTQNPIKKRIETYSIPKNVKFLGLLEHKDFVNRILSKCKAFLMLSTDDPNPLVVFEAKLLNKNVVTIKESGDSHELCDEFDLVLEKYDATAILQYLKTCSPRDDANNLSLSKKIDSNLFTIIDKIEEETQKK